MRAGAGFSFLLLLQIVLLTAGAHAFESSSDTSVQKKHELAKQGQPPPAANAFRSVPYTPQRDMAVVSVMGSSAKGTSFKGFQRAVLYNAKGAILKEFAINRTDSVYVIDKILQENRGKGAVFIKMIR